MGISLLEWIRGSNNKVKRDPSVPSFGSGANKKMMAPYKAAMKYKLGRKEMRVGPPPSTSQVPPMRERSQKRTLKNFYGE